MKKKLLVFALTICMLISFIACGETNEPIITEAPESSSSSNTAGEETIAETETTATEATETEATEATDTTAATETTATEATETETTATEPLGFDYTNNTFPNIRDMVTKLKNGEVKPYGYFAYETWLDVDLNRIYELTNLPDGYYDGLVEWSGKNSYMIYYRSIDYVPEDLNTGDHLDICFEPLENKEQLERYMNGWISPWNNVEDCLKRFSNIRISTAESEYGTMTTWTYDTKTVKDLAFSKLISYNDDGSVNFIYVQNVYGGGETWNYLFNYGEIPYAIIHTGNLSFETLLSLTPVKVEVDG